MSDSRFRKELHLDVKQAKGAIQSIVSKIKQLNKLLKEKQSTTLETKELDKTKQRFSSMVSLVEKYTGRLNKAFIQQSKLQKLINQPGKKGKILDPQELDKLNQKIKSYENVLRRALLKMGELGNENEKFGKSYRYIEASDNAMISLRQATDKTSQGFEYLIKKGRELSVSTSSIGQAMKTEKNKEKLAELRKEYGKIILEVRNFDRLVKGEKGTEGYDKLKNTLRNIDTQINRINQSFKKQDTVSTKVKKVVNVEKELKKELSEIVGQYRKLDRELSNIDHHGNIFKKAEESAKVYRQRIREILAELKKFGHKHAGTILESGKLIDKPFGQTKAPLQRREPTETEIVEKKLKGLNAEYSKLVSAGKSIRSSQGENSAEFKKVSKSAEKAKKEIAQYRNKLLQLKPTSSTVAKSTALLGTSFNTATKKVTSLIGQVSRIKTAFFASVIAVYTLNRAVEKLKNVYIDTLDLLKGLEIGQAGAFNNVYIESFNKSLQRSKSFIKDLLEDSVKLNIDFRVLQETATATLPLLLGKGFTEEQARNIITRMTKGAELMFPQMVGFQAQSEIRALLGQSPINRAQIVQSMGYYSGGQIKTALGKGPEAFTEQIMERAKGFASAGAKSLETVSGQFRKLRTQALYLSAVIGTDVYNATAKFLKELNEGIKTGNFDVTIDTLRQIGKLLKHTVNIASSLIQNLDNIIKLAPSAITAISATWLALSNRKAIGTAISSARGLNNSMVILGDTTSKSTKGLVKNTKGLSGAFSKLGLSSTTLYNGVLLLLTAAPMFIQFISDFYRSINTKKAIKITESGTKMTKDVLKDALKQLEPIKGKIKTGEKIPYEEMERYNKVFETSLKQAKDSIESLRILEGKAKPDKKEGFTKQIKELEPLENSLKEFQIIFDNLNKNIVKTSEELFVKYSPEVAWQKFQEDREIATKELGRLSNKLIEINSELDKFKLEGYDDLKIELSEVSNRFKKFKDVIKFEERPEDFKKIVKGEKKLPTTGWELSSLSSTIEDFKKAGFDIDNISDIISTYDSMNNQINILNGMLKQEESTIKSQQETEENILKLRNAISAADENIYEKMKEEYNTRISDAKNSDLKLAEINKFHSLISDFRQKQLKHYASSFTEEQIQEELLKRRSEINIASGLTGKKLIKANLDYLNELKKQPLSTEERISVAKDTFKKTKSASNIEKDLNKIKEQENQVAQKIIEKKIKMISDIQKTLYTLKEAGIDPSEMKASNKVLSSMSSDLRNMGSKYEDLINGNDELKNKWQEAIKGGILAVDSIDAFLRDFKERLSQKVTDIETRKEISKSELSATREIGDISAPIPTAMMKGLELGIDIRSMEEQKGLLLSHRAEIYDKIEDLKDKYDEAISAGEKLAAQELSKDIEKLVNELTGLDSKFMNLEKSGKLLNIQLKNQNQLMIKAKGLSSANISKASEEIRKIEAKTKALNEQNKISESRKELQHAHKMGFVSDESFIDSEAALKSQEATTLYNQKIEENRQQSLRNLEEFGEKQKGINIRISELKIDLLNETNKTERALMQHQLEALSEQKKSHVSSLVNTTQEGLTNKNSITAKYQAQERALTSEHHRKLEEMHQKNYEAALKRSSPGTQAAPSSGGITVSRFRPAEAHDLARQAHIYGTEDWDETQKAKMQAGMMAIDEEFLFWKSNLEAIYNLMGGMAKVTASSRATRNAAKITYGMKTRPLTYKEKMEKAAYDAQKTLDKIEESFKERLENLNETIGDILKSVSKTSKKPLKIDLLKKALAAINSELDAAMAEHNKFVMLYTISGSHSRTGTVHDSGKFISMSEKDEEFIKTLEERREEINELIEQQQKELDALNKQMSEEIISLKRPLGERAGFKTGYSLVADLKSMVDQGANINLIQELFKLRVQNFADETKKSMEDLRKNIQRGYETESGEMVSITEGLSIDIANVIKAAKENLNNIRGTYNDSALAIIQEDRDVPTIAPEMERRRKLQDLQAKYERERRKILEDRENSISKLENRHKRQLEELMESENDLFAMLKGAFDALTYQSQQLFGSNIVDKNLHSNLIQAQIPQWKTPINNTSKPLSNNNNIIVNLPSSNMNVNEIARIIHSELNKSENIRRMA